MSPAKPDGPRAGALSYFWPSELRAALAADPDCVGFKRVMINPVIYESSKKTSVMEEGCLSIPGIREEVVRPVSVKIEYFNENWDLKEEMLSGVAARIVQHEYDHLDGTVYIDRLSDETKTEVQGRLNEPRPS